MPQAQKTLLIAGLAIVAALTGALLARTFFAPTAPTPLQSGTEIVPPRPLSSFALIDHNAQRFAREQLQGRWSLLFFGFASCGDICPTTMAMLASTVKSLDDLPEAQRPRVVFVSVDPKRDTPQVLNTYVKSFHPDFIGVTGAQADVDAFSLSLGAPSGIRPLEVGYAVDHSGSVFAINPRGEFQAIFSPPHTAAALAADYRILATQR